MKTSIDGLAGLALLSGFSMVLAAQTPKPGGNWEQQLPKDPVGKTMVYKTAEGKPLHAYVLEPSDSAPSHPAIVFFHGGGWRSGSVTQFSKQMTAPAARGMVTIDVEYGLIPKANTTQSPEE